MPLLTIHKVAFNRHNIEWLALSGKHQKAKTFKQLPPSKREVRSGSDVDGKKQRRVVVAKYLPH